MAYREKLTWDGGKEVVITRPTAPVDVVRVDGADVDLVRLSVHDPQLLPTNYADAEGTPLPLLGSDGFRLDLSRLTKQPMGFWHRNMDYDEIIICVQGGMTWETELGTVAIRPGEIVVLPRGVAHRSIPPEGSETANVLIELKVRGDVKPLGTAVPVVRPARAAAPPTGR